MQRSASGSASDEATSMVTRVALIMNSFERAGQAATPGPGRGAPHRAAALVDSSHLAATPDDRAAQHRTGWILPRGIDLPANRSSIIRRYAASLPRARGASRRHLTGGAPRRAVRGGSGLPRQGSERSGVAVPTRVAGRTPAHASAWVKRCSLRFPPRKSTRSSRPLPKCTPATIAGLPDAASRAGAGQIPARTRVRRPGIRGRPVERRGTDPDGRRESWRDSHSPARARPPAQRWRLPHACREAHIGAHRQYRRLRHQATMPTR